MRNPIARALATGAAVTMLAGGAAVASTGTAFATPSASVTHSHAAASDDTPSPSPSPGYKHCVTIGAHHETIPINGKNHKVWIGSHKMCWEK